MKDSIQKYKFLKFSTLQTYTYSNLMTEKKYCEDHLLPYLKPKSTGDGKYLTG